MASTSIQVNGQLNKAFHFKTTFSQLGDQQHVNNVSINLQSGHVEWTSNKDIMLL